MYIKMNGVDHLFSFCVCDIYAHIIRTYNICCIDVVRFYQFFKINCIPMLITCCTCICVYVSQLVQIIDLSLFRGFLINYKFFSILSHSPSKETSVMSPHNSPYQSRNSHKACPVGIQVSSTKQRCSSLLLSISNNVLRFKTM